MVIRILIPALVLTLTACGGDDLPSTATDSSSVVSSTSTTLAIYADSYSLYTGGAANLSVAGGTGPYNYSLSDTTLGTLNGTVFTSTKAGTETITVSDKNGVTAQVGISIIDATAVGPTVSSTIPMYRFRHDVPALWHYFTPSQAGDPGYAPNPEGIGYRVYGTQVSGSIPLYACKMSNYLQIRFNSADIGCEGQNTDGRTVVGYVMPQGTPTTGHTTLWRHKAYVCPNGPSSCYFAIMENLDQNPPSGYTTVGPIANVPIQ